MKTQEIIGFYFGNPQNFNPQGKGPQKEKLSMHCHTKK